MTSEASGAICPWCSAALPKAKAVVCPSCGAALREAKDAEIPGVTKVDPEVVLKSRAPAPRSRLLGWLTGDTPEPEPAPLAPEERASLEPPALEVRREMRRLEIEALRLQAAREAEAFADEPGDVAGDETAGADDSAPDDGTDEAATQA